MELLLKDENGKIIPVKQIGELNAGDLVIRIQFCLCEKDIENYEQELSKKFGRKVIVLDGRFSEILVVPPKNDV